MKCFAPWLYEYKSVIRTVPVYSFKSLTNKSFICALYRKHLEDKKSICKSNSNERLDQSRILNKGDANFFFLMNAASNQNFINNSFALSPLKGTAHLIAKVYLCENDDLYHYSGKNNSENDLNLDSVLMVTSKE